MEDEMVVCGVCKFRYENGDNYTSCPFGKFFSAINEAFSEHFNKDAKDDLLEIILENFGCRFGERRGDDI